MAVTGMKGLLLWCQRATNGYNDVSVTNMTKSFRDGLAFCAIIHHYRPDLIDFHSLSKENVWENNQLAFEVAEKELGIPSLLDPDDLVALPVPDKLSIMTYVSQYYNYFKNKKAALEMGITPKAGIGRTTVKRAIEESPLKEKDGITPVKKASFPSNTCQICGKKVYLVEKVVSNNRLYHRSCFKCNKCGGTLHPGAAKVGSNPNEIECIHHGDKIWNLRTSISTRGKQSTNVNKAAGGKDTIWEENSDVSADKSSQRSRQTQAKQSQSDNTEHVAITKATVTKPPIPTNPPSKTLHPHLYASTDARAQFCKGNASPETSTKSASYKKKENSDKSKALKLGLIASLAGAMAADEAREKKEASIMSDTKIESMKSLINEPTKLNVTDKEVDKPVQKKFDVKPLVSSTSKDASKGIDGNTITSVSQRISMFSRDKEKVDNDMHEPTRPTVKKDETKTSSEEPAKAEESHTEMKPSISGNVNVMIGKMEKQGGDKQVSEEGEGISLRVDKRPEDDMPYSVGPLNQAENKNFNEQEKQDTEVLEKQVHVDKLSGSDVPHISGSNKVDNVKEEVLDLDNPFFTVHEEEMEETEEMKEIEEDEQNVEGHRGHKKEETESEKVIQASKGEIHENESNRLVEAALSGKEEKLEDMTKENKDNKEMEMEEDRASEIKTIMEDSKIVGASDEKGNSEGLEDQSAIVTDVEMDITKNDDATTITNTLVGDEQSGKSEDPIYDDSLNPFGSDDDDEEENSSSDSDNDSDLGPNNPFALSDEEENNDYDDSLNPFGDDDGGEEGDEMVNPFTGSPILKTSFQYTEEHKVKPPRPPPPKTSPVRNVGAPVKTRQEILQEMQRARSTLKQKKRKAPSAPGNTPKSTDGMSPTQPGFQSRSTKSRKAPLPPGVNNNHNITENGVSDSGSPSSTRQSNNQKLCQTPEASPSASPRTKKSGKINRPDFRPPPQPRQKQLTSKRRAPAPPPQKRDVSQNHVTPEEIQRELSEIEAKTSDLEKKGITLEDSLRAVMKDDVSEDTEELLMEWFEVVNEKNLLVRREGELVAQAQIQEFELQHAEVEYELRCLMHKQEHEKTDQDNKREAELLEILVTLVQQRSMIVDRLDEDRIREQEEDENIRSMMQMKGKLLRPVDEFGLDRESIEVKKEKKKKKKKKHKDKDKHKRKET